MKLTLVIIAFAIMSSSAVYSQQAAPEKKWLGVDEIVVNKFAEQAGRPARDPYINTDQGDILLFVFLVAGLVGGFLMGYFYRQLFTANKMERKGVTQK